MLSRIRGTFILLSQNQNLLCVWEKDGQPACTLVLADGEALRTKREGDFPRYDDVYIPRADAQLYSCARPGGCGPLRLRSLSQLSGANLDLRVCHRSGLIRSCEPVRYDRLDSENKIKFLNSFSEDRSYFSVNCLVYDDGVMVCMKVMPGYDTGNVVGRLIDWNVVLRQRKRPGTGAVLVASLDRLICEESKEGMRCDPEALDPVYEGLRSEENPMVVRHVFLKTENSNLNLKYVCNELWCHYEYDGLSENAPEVGPAARRRYDPLDRVFRCYLAKGQQVCKEIIEKIPSEFDGPYGPPEL